MRATLTRPPKGWNSFDAFGWSVDEDEFIAKVEFCDKHLKQFGYDIMTVDFCWSHPGKSDISNPNISETGEKLAMDAFGRLLPSGDRFPSSADGRGFKPLADFVHGKGMKFGIHVMRGMPKQALEFGTPILGSDYTAADAADVSSDHCWWLDHMHPLKMNEASQLYIDSLISLYTEWGVDFIKLDDISSPYSETEIVGYSRAIEKSPREIILSVSPGATPVEKWDHVSRYTDMWRISPDFWDSWDKLLQNFDLFDKWSAYRVDFKYPDGDMIPFGKISLRGPMGRPRYSSFTYDEKKSLMAMWCINSSPLILGGDPSTIDSLSFDLLTNRLFLQMDNSAVNAKMIFNKDGLLIWRADDRSNKSIKYVSVFNLSDEEVKTPRINLSTIKNKASAYMTTMDSAFIYDDKVSLFLPPHSAESFVVK